MNNELFGSSLKRIEIQFLTADQIQAVFDRYNNPRHAEDLYAVYFPVPDWKFMEGNRFSQIKMFNEYMMVNVSNGIMNPAFAVSTICHEMIHYYDTWFGDLLKTTLENFRNGKSYDEHTSEIFQQKQNEANGMGLTIIPDGDDLPIEELNALSAFRTRKKLLSEDERYENMFNALLRRKTDILGKIQVKDDGSPGAIAF